MRRLILFFMLLLAVASGNSLKLNSIFNNIKPNSAKSTGVAISENGYMAVRAFNGIYSVYLYRLEENEWRFDKLISGIDGDDNFGEFMKFDGDMLVIAASAPRFIYTYIYKNDNWRRMNVITVGENEDITTFAVENYKMILGDFFNNNLIGKLDIFEWENGEWVKKHTLSGNSQMKRFGKLTAIYNTTIAVQANDDQTTTIYLYDIAGPTPVLVNQRSLVYNTTHTIDIYDNKLIVAAELRIRLPGSNEDASLNFKTTQYLEVIDIYDNNTTVHEINRIPSDAFIYDKFVIVGFSTTQDDPGKIELYEIENDSLNKIFTKVELGRHPEFPYDENTLVNVGEFLGDHHTFAISDTMFVFNTANFYLDEKQEFSVRTYVYELPTPPTPAPTLSPVGSPTPFPTKSPLPEGVTESPTASPTQTTERPTISPTISSFKNDQNDEKSTTDAIAIAGLVGGSLTILFLLFRIYLKYSGGVTSPPYNRF